MKPIDLHEAARREWQSAAAFYGERDKQLAFDFNQKVWNALREIAGDPFRFPLVQGMHPLRKFQLTRFPFAILYIEYPNRIWVIAIAHQSRRAGFWKQRLR